MSGPPGGLNNNLKNEPPGEGFLHRGVDFFKRPGEGYTVEKSSLRRYGVRRGRQALAVIGRRFLLSASVANTYTRDRQALAVIGRRFLLSASVTNTYTPNALRGDYIRNALKMLGFLY